MPSQVFLVTHVQKGTEVLEINRKEIIWSVTGGVAERYFYRPFIAEGRGL
jgi:hypothetical protein